MNGVLWSKSPTQVTENAYNLFGDHYTYFLNIVFLRSHVPDVWYSKKDE